MKPYPSVETCRGRDRSSESGIALIVVLGFLSVLAIMAISFAVNMRTERMASRLYLDSIRSRQIVDVALARAMEDLDQDMISSVELYPSWDQDQRPSSGGGVSYNIFTGRAPNYVPQFWSGAAATPSMETITIPSADGTADMKARFAYQVFNLSGLLDPNIHGLADDRQEGLNPEEVRVSSSILSDVAGGAQWEIGSGGFGDYLRNDWKRIETVYEFKELGDANGLLKSSEPVRNFFPFSRSLIERKPDGEPKVVISGAETNLVEARTNIVAAFSICGVPNPDNMVFSNLLDYVDADIVPKSLESFCTEPVPMINEIKAEAEATRRVIDSNSGLEEFTLQMTITVELWFPFLPNNETFTLSQVPNIDFVTIPPGSEAYLLPSDIAMLNDINPTNGTTGVVQPNMQPSSITASGTGFYTIEYQYNEKVYQGTGVNPAISSVPVLVAPNTNSIEVLFNGIPVDRVSEVREPGQNYALNLTVPFNGNSDTKSISCLDPRFNHESGNSPNGTPYWKISPETIGALNNNTVNYSSGEPVTVDSMMYVRNAGIQNAAELGFLCIGEPWRTIKLYSGGSFPMHPVLDYFAIRASDTPVSGRVNLNSQTASVLASLYYQLPINSVPGSSSAYDLSTQDAFDIAEDVIEYGQAQTEYDRLSMIGEVQSVYSAGSPYYSYLTTDERIEALIRNVANIISIRQNIFGIVIEAQALSEDDVVMGGSKAFAVVWRDPVEDAASGIHPMYMRYFAWID